jgi:hypothetical protein
LGSVTADEVTYATMSAEIKNRYKRKGKTAS